MNEVFDFIINTRKVFIKLVDSLTIEQLNKIPDGYNNNVIWNLGHIVASTQTLSYVRTGILPDASTFKYIEAYKKDTRPTYFVSEAELAELKTIAIESIEKIKADYEKGIFKQITPYPTSTYGEELKTIEQVLITTIGHDNMHLGYAVALKKWL